jgi:signal transduction histidine kinase
MSDSVEILQYELNETIKSFDFVTNLLAEALKCDDRVQLVQLYLNEFCESVEAEKGIFLMQEQDCLQPRATFGFDEGTKLPNSEQDHDSLAWNVFDIGTSIVIENLQTDSRFKSSEFFESKEHQSVIARCLGADPVFGVFVFYLPKQDLAELRGKLDRIERFLHVLEPHFFAQLDHFKEKLEKSEVVNQYYQAQKMASVGVLAAGVAHEINNPLAIVVGTLEVVQRAFSKVDKEEFPNLGKAIENMQKASQRMRRIVKGLGSYARMDTDEADLISVKGVLLESIEMIQSIYSREGVVINKQVMDEDPLIYGNFGRLQQVIMNLLANAKDSMGEEGGDISVTMFKEDSDVVVTLSDSGCGIPEENLKKIFNPFFTTKESGKGTGLGLGIVNSIIASMKGEITVDSVVGKGTTFSIRFPLS